MLNFSCLQGRVKFPTGGKVREPSGKNRCKSDTDSKVWMEEDIQIGLLCFDAPKVYLRAYFNFGGYLL